MNNRFRNSPNGDGITSLISATHSPPTSASAKNVDFGTVALNAENTHIRMGSAKA